MKKDTQESDFGESSAYCGCLSSINLDECLVNQC